MGKLVLPEDYSKLALDSNNLLEEPKRPKFRIPSEEERFSPSISGYEYEDSQYDLGKPAFWSQDEWRASKQPFTHALGNSILRTASELTLGSAKAITDIPDNLVAIFDMQKAVDEDFGNIFSKTFGAGKDAINRGFPVYRPEDSKGFSPAHWSWWLDNIPSIASSATFIIPTMLAAKGLGAVSKITGLAKALGKQGNQLFKGVGATIYSNMAESLQDALPIAQKAYKDALAQGLTEKQAREIGAQAGYDVYQGNLINIALDLPSTFAIMKGFKGSRNLLGEKSIKRTIFGEVIPEGVQEVVNYISPVEAQRSADIAMGKLKDDGTTLLDRALNDYLQRGDAWTAGFFGAIGGAVMTGALNLRDNRSEKVLRGLQAQRTQELGALNNDSQLFKEGTKDLLFNEVLKHSQSGTMELFEDKLNDIRENWTVEDTKRLGIDKTVIQERLQEAKKMEDVYNDVAYTYTGEVFKPYVPKITKLVYNDQYYSKELRNLNTEINTKKFELLGNLQTQLSEAINLDQVNYTLLTNEIQELEKVLKPQLPEEIRPSIDRIIEEKKQLREVLRENAKILGQKVTNLELNDFTEFKELKDLHKTKAELQAVLQLNKQQLKNFTNKSFLESQTNKAKAEEKKDKPPVPPAPIIKTKFSKDGTILEGDLWKDAKGQEFIKVKEGNKQVSYPVTKDANGNYIYNTKEDTVTEDAPIQPIISNNVFNRLYQGGRFLIRNGFSAINKKGKVVGDVTAFKKYLQTFLQTPLTPDRVKFTVQENLYTKGDINNAQDSESEDIVGAQVRIKSPFLEFSMHLKMNPNDKEWVHVGYLPFNDKFIDLKGNQVDLTKITEEEFRRLFNTDVNFETAIREYKAIKEFEEALGVWMTGKSNTELIVPQDAISPVIIGPLKRLTTEETYPILSDVEAFKNNGRGYVVFDTKLNSYISGERLPDEVDPKDILKTDEKGEVFFGKYALATIPNGLKAWVKLIPRKLTKADLDTLVPLINELEKDLANFKPEGISLEESIKQAQSIIDTKLQLFISSLPDVNINFVANPPNAAVPSWGLEIRVSKVGQESERIKVRTLTTIDDLLTLINSNKLDIKVTKTNFKYDNSQDPKYVKQPFNPTKWESTLGANIFSSYNIKFNFHPEVLTPQGFKPEAGSFIEEVVKEEPKVTTTSSLTLAEATKTKVQLLREGKINTQEYEDNEELIKRLSKEKLERDKGTSSPQAFSIDGDLKPISNLSPELQRVVRTKEFKAWFGDWENDPQNASKVVDKNGEPLIVYHGTGKQFDIFDINKLGEKTGQKGIKGFYFSNIREHARDYTIDRNHRKYEERLLGFVDAYNYSIEIGKSILEFDENDFEVLRERYFRKYEGPSSLNPIAIDNFELAKEADKFFKNNPQVIEKSAKMDDGQLYNDELYGLPKNPEYNPSVYPSFLNIRNPLEINKDKKNLISFSTANNKAKKELKDEDGIIIYYVDDRVSHGSDIYGNNDYVVFESNQIKSIHNQGTFNAKNNSILFSIGTTFGDINLEQESKWIKNNLPDWFSTKYGQDTDELLNRLKNNGITFGQFKDNIIYLHTKAKEGTGYHEAFHAVFRNLLTQPEINKYYAAAKVKYGIPSSTQLNNFRSNSESRTNLTSKQLEDLWYEEHIADDFAQYIVNKSHSTPGIFKVLYNKILDFIKWLTGTHSALDTLFRTINTGRFKNAIKQPNSFNNYGTTEAYKILPSFGATESQEIVWQLAGQVLDDGTNVNLMSKIDNAILGMMLRYDFSNPEVLERFNNLNEYNQIQFVEYSNKLSTLLDDNESLDLVRSEVRKLFTDDITVEDEYNDELNNEDNSAKSFERDILNEGSWNTLSNPIKRFISLTFVEKVDKFGTPIKTIINFPSVFAVVKRTLADTPEGMMIPKLQIVAKHNKDIAAVLDKLINKTGYSQENPTGDPNHLDSRQLLKAFYKNFEGSRISQNYVTVQPGKDKVIHTSANKRTNVDRQTYEAWFNNFLVDIEPLLNNPTNRIAFRDNFNTLNTAWQEYLKTKVGLEDIIKLTQTTFNNIGINLESDYIEASINTESPTIKLLPEDYYLLDLETINLLRDMLYKGINPFAEAEGMINRLIDIARTNSTFAEIPYVDSYQDAHGKQRYTIVPSIQLLERVKFLQEYYTKDENIEQAKKNPYLQYNNIFYNKTNEQIKKYFNELEVSAYGDTREAVTKGEDTINKEGVTYRDIDDLSLISNWLVAYQDNNIPLMIPSTKNLAFESKQPINKLLYNQGISNEALNNIYDTIFVQEFNRLRGDYNQQFKNKQWVNLAFLNDTDVLEGVKEITPELKTQILKLIKDNLENNITDFFEVVKDLGILSNDGIFTVKALEFYTPKDSKSEEEIFKNFIANFYLNTFINNTQLNQLIQGDVALSNNWLDLVKRNTMHNNAGKTRSGRTIRVLYGTEDIREGINTDDGQITVTLQDYKAMKYDFGDLTFKMNDVLDRLENPEIKNGKPQFPTNKEIKEAGIDLISWKPVTSGVDKDSFKEGDVEVKLEGNHIYHKASIRFLSKRLTSYWDNKSKTWKPQRGKEALHNLRVWLEAHSDPTKGQFTQYVPASASKKFTGEMFDHTKFSQGVLQDGKDLPEGFSHRVYTFDGTHQRQQVVTSTPKQLNITTGTQLLQLIDTELPNDLEAIGLRDQLNEILSKQREQAMLWAQRYLIKEGMQKADVTKFLKKLRENIENTNPNPRLFELFQDNGKGDFKYDPNLIPVLKKFEQLFLAHFSKVLKQKSFGDKKTLVTDSGYRILVDKSNPDRIITNEEYISNPEKYNTEEYVTRELKIHKFEDGKLVYAEIAVTRRQADLLGLSINEIYNIDPKILEGLGIRIPTQSHHSMLPFKIVEFLPEEYGSTVIGPKEIVKLSGADFDIDALFSYLKAVYRDEKKNLKVYGQATTDEDRWYEFKRDQYKRNSDVKSYIKEHELKGLDKITNIRDSRLDYEEDTPEDLMNILMGLEDMSAFRYANLPTNLQEFKEGEYIAPSTLDNQLLEVFLKTLSHPALQESMNTPATMTDIVDLSDMIRGLRKQISTKEVTITDNPQYPGKTEFNKLPGKSITPTMTYAGIGSRETPKESLDQMTEVAKYLESIGYTLNTGVTFYNREEGADKAFSDGTKRKNLFSPEKQGLGVREQSVAKELHPAPQYLKPGGLKLMARNTNQIFGENLDTPVDFVLFWTKETSNPLRPAGGTGQAVEMARRKGIPTINMLNSNWRQELDRILFPPLESATIKEGVEKLPKEDRILYNAPDGMYYAWKIGNTGKKNIAIVANANLINANLTKHNIKLKEGHEVTIDGVTYNKFGGTPEEVRAKANDISSMLTSATDNERNPTHGFLNWTFQTLTVYNYMRSIGIPLDVISLFSNQPIMREYAEKRDKLDSAIGIEGKNTKNGRPISAFTLIKTMLDRVSKGHKVDENTITKQELIDDINGKDSLTQYKVLKLYKKLEQDSRYFSKIGSVLKLNKGFGSDFSYIDAVKEDIRLLGLDPKQQLSRSERKLLPFDAKPIVDNNANLKTNIKIMNRVESIANHYFIYKTPSFEELFNKVSLSLHQFLKKEDVTKVKENLLTYLTLRVYEKKLGSNFSNMNFVLYPDLEKNKTTLLQDYRKLWSIPEFKNNPFIKFLRTKEHDGKDRMDRVLSDSRIKLHPQNIELLLDGFTALSRWGQDKEKANSKEVDNFVSKLIAYLLVKDNFQARSDSFINYIAPEEFKFLAQSSKELNILLAQSKDTKELTGKTLEEHFKEFEELFFRHNSNRRKIFSLGNLFDNSNTQLKANPEDKKSENIYNYTGYDDGFKLQLAPKVNTIKQLEDNNLFTIEDRSGTITKVNFPDFVVVRQQSDYLKPYKRVTDTVKEAIYQEVGTFGVTGQSYLHNTPNVMIELSQKLAEQISAEQPMPQPNITKEEEASIDNFNLNDENIQDNWEDGEDIKLQKVGKTNSITSFDEELNKQLEEKLKRLYPNIELEYTNEPVINVITKHLEEEIKRGKFTSTADKELALQALESYKQDKDKRVVRGIANIEAMYVLIDSLIKRQDTLPHEYAHHYIAWFRNTPIVQEGIKQFGNEEGLVKKIGLQVVNQKGEASAWYKRFWNWIKSIFGKEDVLQTLTDAFLTAKKLSKSKLYDKGIFKQAVVSDFEADDEYYDESEDVDTGAKTESAYRVQQVFFNRRLKQLESKLVKLEESTPEYNKLKTEIDELTAKFEQAVRLQSHEIYKDLGTNILAELEKFIVRIETYGVDKDKEAEYILYSKDVIDAWEEFEDLETTTKKLKKRLFPFIHKFVVDEVNQYATEKDPITQEMIDKQNRDIGTFTKGTGTLANLANYIGRTIGSIIKQAQNRVSVRNKEFTEVVKEEIDRLEKYAKENSLKLQEVYDMFVQEHKGTLDLVSPVLEDGSVNPNWAKVQGTPELKRFFDFWQRSMQVANSILPVAIDQYFIPNIGKEDIFSDIKGLNPVKTRSIDLIPNDEELFADVVPLKYIKKIPSEEKSKDLGKSLLTFLSFAAEHQEMSNILPRVRLLQEELKYKYNSNTGIISKRQFVKNSNPNVSIVGEDSNLYKMVKDYISMQVKGRMKDTDQGKKRLYVTKYDADGNPIEEKYVDFAGAIDNLLRWNSLLRIGFSPITAGANVLFGDVTNIIEAFGNRFFSLKQLHQATNIFFKQANWNPASGEKSTFLYEVLERLNPLAELDDYENLSTVRVGSKMSKEKFLEYAYSMQKKGELFLQSRTMLAIMLKDGYITPDGKPTEKWSKITNEEAEQLSEKIQALNGRIHGRYSQREAGTLYQNVWYRMFSQFRKWLPAAWEQRFAEYQYDNRLGVPFEGRYITFYNLIRNLRDTRKRLKEGKLTELELYNMRKMLVEVTLMLATAFAFMWLKGGDDEEDKRRRKNPMVKTGLTLLNRVSGDIIFFYSPNKFNELMKNAAPVNKLVGDLIKISTVYLPYAFYVGDWKTKRGSNKGTNKFYRTLRGVTPGVKAGQDIMRMANSEALEELR